MDNPQTRRKLRDKLAARGTPSEPRGRLPWMSILLVLAVGSVALLGYAFVRRMFIAPPIDAVIERQDDMVRKGARIQVSVLNSATGKGVARHTMDYLRARGFDVVEIGNTEEPRRQSLVIDRVNDSVSAKKVAFALGIADSCIRREENRKLFLDVTVILGDDYEQLRPWR